MRIIVVSSYNPFIESGHVALVEGLEKALKAQKHEVDSVLIPFNPRWAEVTEQLLAIRSLDLTHASGQKVDLLITLRHPAYAVVHDNKVCWLHDQYRSAYQLSGIESQHIPNSLEGMKMREAILRSDNLYVSEHKKVFPISTQLEKSLKKHHQLETTGVLLSPLPNPDPYYDGNQGNYFICTGQFTPGKRQTLLIEAMSRVRSPFQLVLASTGNSEHDDQQIRRLIEKYSLESRVMLRSQLSEREKAELVSNALAVLDIASEEDCCDYAALEGFHAHRPVITCIDSPSSQDLVVHERNGFVVKPAADILAQTMESIWSKKTLVKDLGENAYRTLSEKQLNWNHVVEKLTQ